MINPEDIYLKLIMLLDENKVEYKLFSHEPVLSYDDSARVQKNAGYFGTEGKCLVLKAGDVFIVYITLQGNRVNFDAIRQALGINKIRLASHEELKEYFGAEPGCAYPFGFSKDIGIFVDPRIYEQEWFLFSPVVSTKTVQAKGRDLKNVFSNLENKVTEVQNFNQ